MSWLGQNARLNKLPHLDAGGFCRMLRSHARDQLGSALGLGFPQTLASVLKNTVFTGGRGHAAD